jgi:hypothetical protein
VSRHGRLEAVAAQGLQDVEAVALGQHHVEDHEIPGGSVGRALYRLVAVRRHLHGVPFLFEAFANEARDLSIVFHHEDPHRLQLSPTPRALSMPTARTVLSSGVLDPSHLFQHFGYAAILVVVLLGNAGVPAPEESVLVFGGYLAWQGRLELPLVILVGIISASLGDNFGFWVGRRYGQRAIARLPLPQARLAQAQSLITRYGARAVFASRFVAGFRTVAGPLAGAGGRRLSASRQSGRGVRRY